MHTFLGKLDLLKTCTRLEVPRGVANGRQGPVPGWWHGGKDRSSGQFVFLTPGIYHIAIEAMIFEYPSSALSSMDTDSLLPAQSGSASICRRLNLILCIEQQCYVGRDVAQFLPDVLCGIC